MGDAGLKVYGTSDSALLPDINASTCRLRTAGGRAQEDVQLDERACEATFSSAVLCVTPCEGPRRRGRGNTRSFGVPNGQFKTRTDISIPVLERDSETRKALVTSEI